MEDYAKAQGLWRCKGPPYPEFSSTLKLDMGEVVANLAGHKRPQDRITLGTAKEKFNEVLSEVFEVSKIRSQNIEQGEFQGTQLSDGDVVIAAITSCTNTSNPSVMMAAGLVAKNAVERGLKVKPWVKTSLAPGSQVVGEYLRAADLLRPLEQLGFHLVGYGCTTCIGNSGPLPGPIADAIERGDLVATSVLSGNRNFEGRISSHVKANFLGSPPLVVAYALAGTLNINLEKDALGEDPEGNGVYLKDLWPSNHQVRQAISDHLSPQMFKEKYANVFEGEEQWQEVESKGGETYRWNPLSSYVQRPPYFDGMTLELPPLQDIKGARPLAILGDSVTTDHISPAGPIAEDSPAGKYLRAQGVEVFDFNSYGSRRGNHEVMMRGTFANIRLRNEMVPGIEGGWTKEWPSGDKTSIFEAAMEYKKRQTSLVIVAGSEYGTGSSRDWAAKGTSLLGVVAVMAESFERIHRSNLIGMGVLPLQFVSGVGKSDLELDGSEVFDILDLEGLTPRGQVMVNMTRVNGKGQKLNFDCRLDTQDEFDYYRQGGILHYVLRSLVED